MKILFVRNDSYGSGTYRVVVPSVFLSRIGVPSQVIYMDNPIITQDIEKICVFQRHFLPEMFVHICRKKTKQIKIVIDIDDNFFEQINNLRLTKISDQQREAILTSVKMADGVIVSSRYLADLLKDYNEKIAVIPNMFPDDFIPQMPEKYDPLTFLFAGSATHTEELQPAVNAINNAYGDKAKLIIISDPALYNDIKTGDIKTIFHTFINQTTEYFSALNFIAAKYRPQFGLAPLNQTAFNKAKAYQKAIEYALCGAIPLCSDIEPYRDFNDTLTNKCPLVKHNKVEDWEAVMTKDYSSLRPKLNREVRVKHRATRNIKQYLNFFKTFL